MSHIGAATTRFDGPAKVSGSAPFLADLPSADVADGVFVPSTIAAGLVGAIDDAAARAVPGVHAVLVADDMPRLAESDHWALGQTTVPLQSNRVTYVGQPVALVVADAVSTARAAARNVKVRYEATAPRLGLDRHADEAIEIDGLAPSSTETGDVDAALAKAAVRIDGTYRTANRHHAALEPAGAIARWDGDHLDLWTSTQWVFGVRTALAKLLEVSPDKIRVRSSHVGGGFGAKGSVWPHEIVAAVAARLLSRPVRILLSRDQTFYAHGYQPETIQHIALGADVDGRLVGISHDSVSAAAVADDYVEQGSMGTRTMYACPNIRTRDRIVRLNQPQPTFMRAPHEGPGMVGLEIAMDELAAAIGVDPLELRLRNYATADPTSNKPFSSKALDDCYRLGAERFGWTTRGRPTSPADTGSIRVGFGMASALMATFRFGSSARVTVRRAGDVLVETASHDIGTGIHTILPQIVADALGVPPARVAVRLSDTTLPEAGGTFGSGTTMGVGSAVQAAATQLRRKLEDLGGEPDLEAEEYGEVLALRGLEQVDQTAHWAPRREDSALAMNAYGAVFAEVRIDPDLPMPRVTRVVGAYSAGTIINPLTARSQIIGGIVWGIGQALTETSPVDATTGRFVPAGYASYKVPTHADVPAVDAFFVEESDPAASPLGARGVGEIGTIGIGAAIANAVTDAIGVRVRDVPIRVEDLLVG